MIRKCKSCGEPLVGRSDKKFCDDQCRNTFNSKIKRENEEFMLSINKHLRINRKILKQLNPEGKTTIRKEYLSQLGFNFRYFTHTYKSKGGNVYKFCYEYGYFEIDADKVLIINWQPFMEKY